MAGKKNKKQPAKKKTPVSTPAGQTVLAWEDILRVTPRCPCRRRSC